MKICVAHDRIGAGDGSSRYVQGVIARLCDAGHDVLVSCPEIGLDLHPEAQRVAELDEDVDLLFGSDPVRLTSHADRAQRLVYAPLGSLPWLEAPAEEAQLRPLEADLLHRCDALLRFTTAGVRLLETTYDVDLGAKTHVAPWFHHAPHDEPSFTRDAPRLLWVGRLTGTKHVAFLVNALARVQTPGAHLDIVGTGPERAALEQQVAAAGLDGQVTFHGRVDDADLATAYARAALFLTASRVEHYSLTLMEAYAVGTPCIGLRPDMQTIFNACDEQIEEGATGHLVDTPEEMARTIDALLGDEPRRQAYGEAGWRRFREAWADDAFGRALAAAINASPASSDGSPSPR